MMKNREGAVERAGTVDGHLAIRPDGAVAFINQDQFFFGHRLCLAGVRDWAQDFRSRSFGCRSLGCRELGGFGTQTLDPPCEVDDKPRVGAGADGSISSLASTSNTTLRPSTANDPHG